SGKKKFFLTAPYPYVNSILHIGHLYTFMRTEAFARFKRMQGYNVLYPQGWHATGSPIVSAANRVKEKEPKQLAILKQVGVKDEDLVKFEDPAYWLEYFIPKAINDFKSMGMSVDWRRQFHTTSLNPHYDKFIQWQFRTLKEKGYVVKGKFPVVWCPKDQCAVSDHSRSEGEGETPQEFCLVKHKLTDGKFLVTATLRQDTILGITNLYVNPEAEYHEVEVDGEIWIVGKPIISRLQEQGFTVEEKQVVQGRLLVGKKAEVFGGRQVFILPATFLDPKFGTGIVHSVPSDSADDLIALWDLQKDEETLKKYDLPVEEIKAIKPIAVLKTEGYSDIPAEDFLKKYNVKSQNERGKLDKIKKELYKLSHHSAKFNELYNGVFSKNLEGVAVEEGKEMIKQDLLDKGVIKLYYQLTGKVVCRCLTESTVKIVDDQWFMNYGDENWKKQVHKAFDNMKLYPEKSRGQFEYVIDWLHNWACTRKSGLGTRLPWDKDWLIESLSDSTIYMAYYTIVHKLEGLPIEQVDDALFDYVLLGKDVSLKIDSNLALEMRDEFNYWYPCDFRNSGKDLVQNHLTFYVFNHTAIFPEHQWPKGIGVNGWVNVDGEKMAKSKGNIIALRDMPEKFGVDCARFTILSGGEDMDDPNWDSAFATALKGKLFQMYEFCVESYNKGRDQRLQIDDWFESRIQEVIVKCTAEMEKTFFRSALQAAYFELQNILKWYTRRCDGVYNKESISLFILTQVKLLAPVTPFVCEEIWEKLGKESYCSVASWPVATENKIDCKLVLGEETMRNVLQDTSAVMKLAKLEKLSSLKLFVAASWKFELFNELRSLNSRDPREVLQTLMKKDSLKQHGQDIVKLVPKLVKSGKFDSFSSSDEELNYLSEAKSFLEKEFGCNVQIISAEETEHVKGKAALPGRVGILVD
ncbi:leucine--tRNA ligase, partial [Candidatus Woesearchaeota archaeon]|nr:leucine--tRNA ligase [Candidatus Woesearchaeota archaeon]